MKREEKLVKSKRSSPKRYIMRYPKLFSPINIRGCILPNRIQMTAAVTRLAGEDGHVTKEIKDRYERIAMGGLGSIVVEAAVVLPSRSSFNLRISDDQFIDQLRDFIQGMKKVNPDVKVGIQLIHFLKLSRTGWRQKVEDLKPEEIAVIPQQFADGAARARIAGFDFVELHMSHFTTLASFLSLRNKREDEYGGDFEGRIKLPTEVITASRKSVGTDYPVGLRMLGEEFIKEGNTLLQSERIAKRFASLDIDFISVSAGERFEDADPPLPEMPVFAGTGYSGYRMSPRWWNPDGVQVYLAEGIRKAVRESGHDVAVVTAGKIRMPDLAEKILEEGRADIIGMARTLWADPDWPQKAWTGKADEIVKCAACGYCSESDERYETVTCIEWPKGELHPPYPWYLEPPCKAECPAGLDVRTYVDLTARGRHNEALDVIMEKVPFPGTVGRVCPHPCETKCNRRGYDGSVAINNLERFIADAAFTQKIKEPCIPSRTRKERVAVVGSGPAGLTAAYELARLGYGVTVFEAESIPGGMLSLGIPEYRLPRQVVIKEIEHIQKCGVEIRLNSRVGEKGLTIAGLLQDGYKAVFIATGAHASAPLGVAGQETEGVIEGLEFLKRANLKEEITIGKKVVIVGGGYVAVDAARTARRLGSEEVSVVAWNGDSEEKPQPILRRTGAAESEGVKFLQRVVPIKVLSNNGKVVGLECTKTQASDDNQKGQKKQIPIKGSEFVIDADTIIASVDEIPDPKVFSDIAPDLTPKGILMVKSGSFMTSVAGVFAGGDVVSGPATVIEAVASGMKAASAIDRYLNGNDPVSEKIIPNTITLDDVDVDRFRKRPRQKGALLSAEERASTLKEVEIGLQTFEALRESDRCFQCGLFPKKPESH
jgi:NADPH-dependent glutamate synthase beta subunit-like oxidoreductase/2,4-dienoyl-CoA reductase-like NADH-dependent reductase (Old Yellow Enzyme family)